MRVGPAEQQAWAACVLCAAFGQHRGPAHQARALPALRMLGSGSDGCHFGWLLHRASLLKAAAGSSKQPAAAPALQQPGMDLQAYVS